MTGLGVDCSQSVSGAALVAAGYRFAARYLSRYPGPKVLKAAERDDLLAAGADIVLVYEDNTTDAMMGVSGGTNNAYRALKMAADLGAPKGMCLYFACDQNDATAAQVTPYYTAIAAVIDTDYQVGFYGAQAPARALLDAGVVDKAWVVETWRDGGPLDPFHLMQIVGPNVVVGGTQCDEDQILRPDYGGWNSREVAPMYSPALTLQPIVADLACPTGGAWLLAADGSVYAFGGAPYHGGANGQGYFAGRSAAHLELPVAGKDPAASTYVIVATSAERYGF